MLIVAAALMVATSPPAPQTRLDFGMDAGPGKDAGPAPRSEAAKGAVAGQRAQRQRPSRSSPRAAVTDYYLDLDRRRFTDAWRILSPAVRAGFVSFESWRAGYATTLRSRPGSMRISEHEGGASVALLLAAADRASCGTLRRSFAVSWELRRAGRGWRAERLTAVERPGAGPARCEPRHDGAGGGR